jgi:hypothetical protein
LYLNSVEENFGLIAGVEVITNRLKTQYGIRAKKMNRYKTFKLYVKDELD